MSDEFSVDNRSFADGYDPMWTALDKPDAYSTSSGASALHFYNSSTVTTEGGFLKITPRIQTTSWSYYSYVTKKWIPQTRYFSSGMMQSWNKFCYTGGIMEIDIVFPGDPHIGGLWPAVWLLGNLGRATYESTTNNMWPWSYNVCNRGLQLAQKISACNQVNPFGMHPFQGRGATEIDLVEVMSGPKGPPLPGTNPGITLPYADMTLQVKYSSEMFLGLVQHIISPDSSAHSLHQESHTTGHNLAHRLYARTQSQPMVRRSSSPRHGTRA